MIRRGFGVAGVLLGWLLGSFAGVPAVLAQENRIDVQSYSIEAELFPATHLMTAKAKIDFIPQLDLLTVAFELHRGLRVQRVLDAGGNPLNFRQDTGIQLNVDFVNPQPEGKLTSLTVHYGGALASAEGSPVENLQLAYIGPEGTYLLYSARWFPVSDYSMDRFSSVIRITVPSDEMVVASGGPGEPVRRPGKVTYTYRDTHASFPGTVVAGSYRKFPASKSGVNLNVYLKEDNAELAQTYHEAAWEILTYYSDQLGSYPFKRLTLVEIEDGTVGGYASPGLVLVASRGMTPQVNYNLLGHQLAHQWWRCLVSPETLNDRFLEEGLATYSAAMLEEEIMGQAAFERTMGKLAVGSLTQEDAAPISQSGFLREFSAEYQSVVFQKGAMVFHMLRYLIGEEPFWGALRTMVEDFAWDSVSTDDFQVLTEEKGGQDLTFFFAQWVSSTGVPEFERSWVVYRVREGYQTVGKVQQNLDIFRMPVEIRILAEGARPVSYLVEMVGTTTDFTINTRTKPLKVIVDPASRILKYDDRVRYQVQLARADQLLREQAYLEAIRQYQRVLEMNRNSSLAHYRIGEVFFKLHNFQAANKSLRDALQGDLNPKWIEVWSHLTLGKIFDLTGNRDRAVNEYRRALQTNDNAQGALDQARKHLKEPYRETSRRIS